MRKNVILVNYTGRKGGGPVYAYEMTKGLVDNGEKVAVILSDDIENLDKWKKLKLVKLLLIPTYNNNIDFIYKTVFFSFWRKKIKKAFSHIEVKAVYCPMQCPWTPLINALFQDSRKIVTIHDPIHHSGTSMLIKLWPDNSFYTADDIVILSKKFTKYVSQRYKKDLKNICVIPHGRFSYYKDYQKHEPIAQYPDDCINFLFFGRICEYKGLKVLAKAYQIVSEKNEHVTLTIAGSGDFQDYEQDYRMLPRVTVINRWFEDEEIGSLFVGKNIVTVLPYIDATQSGVIPIAMEYDSPVIASNTGGLSEQIVHQSTGVLFKVGNAEDLAKKMLYLSRHPEERQRLTQNAYESLQELDWRYLTKKLIKIIHVPGEGE